MALRLDDRWIWDSWYVWDGDLCHAFYLCASRGLRNAHERHRAPSIGHAVSRNLVEWTVLPDALAPSHQPGFDSWTTWTGSTVRGDDGVWRMFYTGSSREDGGLIQRIGLATSDDLVTWTKAPRPVIEADPLWYETLEQQTWPDQAWRDPWVFKRPNESGWSMLITARHREGDPQTRAAVGLATSENLTTWNVGAPLSSPDQGFGQYEVLQYEEVDGVAVIVFCCGWRELAPARRESLGKIDATYSLVVNRELEGLDFTKARPFLDAVVYAGRLVQKRTGEWFLIGFLNEVDGVFVGELSDPIPVTADPQVGLIAKA